jgi:hypothetical protein
VQNQGKERPAITLEETRPMLEAGQPSTLRRSFTSCKGSLLAGYAKEGVRRALEGKGGVAVPKFEYQSNFLHIILLFIVID